MADQQYKFQNETVTADPNVSTTVNTGAGVTNVVSSDQLKPTPPVTIPTTQPDTTKSDGVVDGANSTVTSTQDFLKTLTPEQTATDQSYNAILDSIASLTGQDTGKTKALAQERMNAGVPDLQKTLTDLNGQITVGNAAYSKLVADAEAKKAALEANSAGITTSVLSGQQGAVDRQANSERAVKAAEIGMLAARAQAVSGNLQTALTIASNAVDAKYAPIEDELKVKAAQLAAIEPLLTKEEKQTALKQKLLIDERTQKIADEKQKAKDIQSIVLEAAKNGASQGVLKQITDSTDVNAATQLATPFLAKVQTEVVEVNGRKVLINSQTGKTVADLGRVVVQGGVNAGSEEILAQLGFHTGQDGKVDPGAYLTLRATSKMSAAEFDNKYGYTLSPQEQQRLGVTSTKPATDVQNVAAGYADRMIQANAVLKNLTGTVAGYNPIAFLTQFKLPSYLQSSSIQQQSQAERNFVNAILRKESGAAISQGEFDSYTKQYFARPGDSPETIAQKEQNRQTAINNLNREAGPAASNSSSSSNNDPLGIR